MAIVYRREDQRLDRFGDGAGLVAVWRQVTADTNPHMGCGEAVFEDCVLEATLPYDEYLCCIEGEIGIALADGDVVLRPRDAIFLPKGTALTYRVTGRAVGIYALAPVDWKARAARGEA
jgi:ethanolamine utilization protein EutQ (cupin superfamily)